MPFFSIIIPLYNKEKFLKATLKSVFEQTFTDYEVIIINDGSTDKSLQIAERFKSENLKIITQNNQGVSVARNIGIENASASYCCFLDADDYWKKNHLESLFKLVHEFKNADFFCSRYITEISKNIFSKNTFDFDDSYQGYINDFFKSSLVSRIATSSSTCIRKKIYDEIGGFNPEINSGEDLDYWIRIALKYQVAISNQTTVVYNFIIENQSLSRVQIENKKLLNLNQYQSEEKQNKALKHFLDIYRIEFALHFHIIGNREKKQFYIKNVHGEHLHFKTKILLKTPSYILRKLLYTKRYLKKFGIDFSVYH